MANNVTKYWVQSLIKGCFKSDKAKETLNTYSTDEQVIGTWIDGKTIYRKTFSYTATANGGDILLDSTLTMSKCLIIDAYGTIIYGDSYISSMHSTEVGTSTSYSHFAVFANSGGLYARNYLGAGTFYVTVEYAKN